MELISIILPIYNAQDTLERALISLLSQTHPNIEIICINDGSRDTSQAILNAYKEKDHRISVFYQDNAGLSAAKNKGIAAAKGSYLMFCDQNGYYELNMCEDMLSCMLKEHVDFAMCDIAVHENMKNHKRDISTVMNQSLQHVGFFNLDIEPKPLIYPVVRNKIFRVDIIKKHNITFPLAVHFRNDDAFVANYTFVSSSCFGINKKLYNYVIYPKNDHHTYNSENETYQFLKMMQFSINFLHKLNIAHKNLHVFEKLNNYVKKNNEEICNSPRNIKILQELENSIVNKDFEYIYIKKFIKSVVNPVYIHNKKCILFPINDSIAPFLGISLLSIIKNANSKNVYDICLLYTKFSNKYIIKIKKLQKENISIRFVSLESYLEDNEDSVHIDFEKHNLYIQKIFSNYDNVAYFQAYTLFHGDAANVFAFPSLANKPLVDISKNSPQEGVGLYTTYEKELSVDHWQAWEECGYGTVFYEDLLYNTGGYRSCIARRYKPSVKQKTDSTHENNKYKLIPIAFASDNNYAPYLGVLFQSIANHSSAQTFYKFIVLETHISQENKEKMYKIVNAYNNIDLEFLDMSTYIKDIKLPLTSYYTVETYYRLFAQNLFKNYDKVLYIDVDTIVNADINELYSTDIEGYTLGACRNFITIPHAMCNLELNNVGPFGDYLTQTLKMENAYNYFQAGVLVLNIKRMQELNIQAKALEKLQVLKPHFVDQDILNILCEGQVKTLPLQWNLFNHFGGGYGNGFWANRCLSEDFEDFKKALKSPKLIHFASNDKRPWKNPMVPYADIWWHHARQTPFYEDIISKNIK